jgi:hypothetical protein
MTVSSPSGRLSKDLANGFPDSLKDITNSELRELLQTHDPTPNSSTGSGVLDWADLPDRLHFIIDLFRCYQENQDLFIPPFQPEQVRALRAGKIPPGKQAGYSTWAGCMVGRGGSLNFNQAGTTVTRETMAVMRKGRRGVKRSHNCAPTQGAGREMKPRLL